MILSPIYFVFQFHFLHNFNLTSLNVRNDCFLYVKSYAELPWLLGNQQSFPDRSKIAKRATYCYCVDIQTYNFLTLWAWILPTGFLSRNFSIKTVSKTFLWPPAYIYNPSTRKSQCDCAFSQIAQPSFWPIYAFVVLVFLFGQLKHLMILILCWTEAVGRKYWSSGNSPSMAFWSYLLNWKLTWKSQVFSFFLLKVDALTEELFFMREILWKIFLDFNIVT